MGELSVPPFFFFLLLSLHSSLRLPVLGCFNLFFTTIHTSPLDLALLYSYIIHAHAHFSRPTQSIISNIISAFALI